tara:strand:+ start:133 stop:822 length:690 start_codon:yes stop_codon:yes gene_type:complete
LKKIICIFILTSQISWAQEIRVIDNKGTINNFRNNQLTNSVIEPANPLENDVWFNSLITKIWDGTAWKSMLSESKSKTLILNKEDGNLQTTNARLDLPLTTGDRVTSNTDTYYTVINIPGDGVQIEILKAGNYLISAELSVDNMPAGDTEYELAILINDVIAGYLSQGYASIRPKPIPDNPEDEMGIGITGALMYVLAAEDTINIQYILDANVPLDLNAPFLKIGITKL